MSFISGGGPSFDYLKILSKYVKKVIINPEYLKFEEPLINKECKTEYLFLNYGIKFNLLKSFSNLFINIKRLRVCRMFLKPHKS
jgi:hypothetical protein